MAKFVIEITEEGLTASEIKQLIGTISVGEIHNLLCDGETLDMLCAGKLVGSVRITE